MITTIIIYAILIAVATAVLFYIEVGICSLVDIMYQAIEKFAGITKVRYDNRSTYLINVFFSTDGINNVYWGMALIGIALLIGFTIVAVIKKAFDTEDKVKNTYGSILGTAFKSLILIISMNFIVSATLLATNVLVQQISYIFNNKDSLGEIYKITYTDEMFAKMANVLDTVGNYSLTPSRTNRYNVNSCFNDIREDLQWLDKELVFHFDYTDYAEQNGECWQSLLEKIAQCAYLGEDQDVNVYNEAITQTLDYAFQVMDNNSNFYPLQSFSVTPTVKEVQNGSVPMGAMMFLSASFDAAKNKKYNGVNAALDDPVRGPYIQGRRNYKSFGKIKSDFNFWSDFNHITLIISSIFIAREFVAILINCVARIFNMLLLYLVAPPFIATMPMDDGAKFKQWTLAFTIQSLSVVGQIVMIRLYAMFVPIIMSGSLVIFENGTANALCKVILMIGAAVTAKEATGLFTGILAEQAGMSAIRAGDVGGKVAKAAGSMAGSLVGAGVGVAAATVGAGVKPAVAALTAKKGGGAGGGKGGEAGGGKAGGSKGGGSGPASVGAKGDDAQVADGGDNGESDAPETAPASVGDENGGSGGEDGGAPSGGPASVGDESGGSGGEDGGAPSGGPAGLSDMNDDDPADEEGPSSGGRSAAAKNAAIDALKDVGYSVLEAGKTGLNEMSKVASMAMTGDTDGEGYFDAQEKKKKEESLRDAHEKSTAKRNAMNQKADAKAQRKFESKNRDIPIKK